MFNKLRWGILATGNIAHQMTQDLLHAEHSVVTAVASRDVRKAEGFARQYQIAHAYGNYLSLCQSEQVDIIYIASPHSEHAEHINMALNGGKHVLCEKPMTLNERQTRSCIALAQNKGLFLMEGLWMRFFPLFDVVKQWLAEEKIGTPRKLTADFCLDIPFDAEHRLFNPTLGGGALLDLGIYPLSLCLDLFGVPEQICGEALCSTTGVDAQSTIYANYPRGLMAELRCSLQEELPAVATIHGDKGVIEIHRRFFCPDKVSLTLSGSDTIVTKSKPYQGNGYQYEINEVENCLLNGRLQSRKFPHSESLNIIKIMDQLRHRWGIKYDIE